MSTINMNLIDRQNRRTTLPPQPGDLTVDELMKRTAEQVAAYFVPDIVHEHTGCTSRYYSSEQPHKQVVLAELFNRLLEKAEKAEKGK